MVNMGLSIPIKIGSIGGGATATSSMTKTEHSHHIFVEINMDTYYASVDEARTRMGASAASLLRKNDIPGFFSACGSYYVRSLGRNAKFISIYTYTTQTMEVDTSFEANLKADIMSFASAGVGPAACGSEGQCPSPGGAIGSVVGAVTGGGEDSGTAGEPAQDGGASAAPAGGSSAPAAGGGGGASVSGGMKMSMAAKSASYKLSITTRAYGLGKNEGATLISYDVPTFKAAVKDAFISMQNPMTGKVTNMEIVPWVENTDFQNLIALEKDVPDPITGKAMLMYKKKQILNGNAEFLAELERHDRNLLNIYYKTKICKQTVEANWMQDKEKILPEYKDLEIGNNKFPLKKMRLDKLIEGHLTEKKIEELIKKEETFMYGSNGANVCIMKLLESGMFVRSYRDISECKQLRGKLSSVIGDVVDNYCMPEQAKRIIRDRPSDAAEATPTPVAAQ